MQRLIPEMKGLYLMSEEMAALFRDSEEVSDDNEDTGDDGEASVNHFTTGKSFDELEETKVANDVATGIRFAFDFQLHSDLVSKLQAVGDKIQSPSNGCCVLHHLHVSYFFGYTITVVDGLLCELRMLPIGHTFQYEDVGYIVSDYKPPAPELMDVKMTIGGFDSCVSLEFLRAFTQNGPAELHAEMTVAEDYFDMAKYIDVNLHQPPAAPNTERLVAKILGGKRVPNSDWVITVVGEDGSRHDFHVHGSVLTGASELLSSTLQERVSFAYLKMVPNENRFILDGLEAEDMRVLLTFIYHRRFALPPFDAFARIGPVLTMMFSTEIADIFKHWEAAMVRNVQRLDKTKHVKTIAECVKVLIAVHSMPPGAALAAFHAAVTVGADAWQMAEARGKMVTSEKVKKAVDRDWPIVDYHIDYIENFKGLMCAVEKSKIVH